MRAQADNISCQYLPDLGGFPVLPAIKAWGSETIAVIATLRLRRGRNLSKDELKFVNLSSGAGYFGSNADRFMVSGGNNLKKVILSEFCLEVF